MYSEETPSLSAGDFAGAMVTAARKLGLEGTFLRMVAAELPDASWRPTWTLSGKGDNVVTSTAAHQCLPNCPGTAGQCLTALKVEEVVSKQMGCPYVVESVRLEGHTLFLRLQPFV